jgi:UDP:flavonoid glycosyltransferase YjiC (YdhE family)
MRVLITTNAATGHFLPLVPTGRALSNAGHEVRFACPATFASVISRADFTVLACDERPTDVGAVPPPPQDDRDGRLAWAVTTGWPSDARSWIADLSAKTEKWRPDVVVVEPMEHAGRIVAAVLGIPVVEHGWGFTLPAGMTHAGTQSLADLYIAAGVAPTRPALTIDLGPAEIQSTDSENVDRYRYVPWSPLGQALPPRDGRLRLLVTLGTYANPDAARNMRIIVESARAQNMQVIAVLGHSDRGTREDFPADVTVLDWVDMSGAIASSDLVAHHGGAGTSWSALLAGKAALVIPQAGDQFRNAYLLQRSSAALVIEPTNCDIDTVGSAFDILTRTPTFSKSAQDIAALNAELPDLRDLATTIANLQPHSS